MARQGQDDEGRKAGKEHNHIKGSDWCPGAVTNVGEDLGQAKGMARERYIRASEAGQGKAKLGEI